MGPVFREAVHGGSQGTLRDVALHLGALGHDCKIFCTRRQDNAVPFSLGPNVNVHPILAFKETYPEPYYAPPYQLRDVVTTLQDALDDADAFYVHDAELLYHFIYEAVPTTIAFQDFVYPDTLAGALSFRRDRLLVTSDYVRRCVATTFSEFRDMEPADVRVVPNGFDSAVFRSVPSGALRRELGLRPDDLAVLYPHRPDPRKGLRDAIDALALAADGLPDALRPRLKLLVPRWMDSAIQKDGDHIYQTIYSEAEELARERGIAGALRVHDWIATRRMPEYYSLGVVTLCIGSFIEAFGNVSVESELCGTPAIVSRVAAQREVLPDDLCSKIDVGDIATAAELIRGHIMESSARTTEIRSYVEEAYPLSRTLAGYADAITTNVLRLPLAAKRLRPISAGDAVMCPPWCASLERGYYNDYAYGYATDQSLISLIRSGRRHIPVDEILVQGIQIEALRAWVGGGWLARASLVAET